MCKNGTGDFKQGTFFSTYHESFSGITKVGIAPIDEDINIIGDYTYFQIHDFGKYFSYVDDYIFIKSKREITYPFKHANLLRKLLKKPVIIDTEYDEKYISFKFDIKTRLEVYSKVLLYIELIEEDEILYKFSDVIYYTVFSLNELYKQRNTIDFDKEINKASEVMKGIYTFYKNIESNIDKKRSKPSNLSNVIVKHEILMESYLNMIQELNKID